jgi:hypothetical protein
LYEIGVELLYAYLIFSNSKQRVAPAQVAQKQLDNEERVMRTGSVAALIISALTLFPASGYADAQQDQNACVNDAMNICSQFIPDRTRVAGCLMSNRNRISPSCRAQLAHWHD